MNVATYGERLLATAEARATARTLRRRFFTMMLPTCLVEAWALTDLLGARIARMDATGTGLVGTVIDLLGPTTWTVLFVLLPTVAALKRDSLPAGAVLALLAGPVLSPILFGPGGWAWWQVAVVAAMTVLVLGAAMQRARTIVLD